MHSGAYEERAQFIELLTEFGHDWKVVFGIPFGLCLIAAVISFLLPSQFTAKTMVLPPQQQPSAATAILDQLGPLAGMAASASGLKSPSDLYAAFLKSATVRDSLITKFKLQDKYGEKLRSDAHKVLSKHIDISVDKVSGLISISATDRDPKFAADLANAHMEAMQGLLGRLSLSDAQQRRKFFAEQVNSVSEKPFRDVRVQELILSSMIRQYELARIDEAKEGPLLQQVDVATPPDKRSKPMRGLIVLIAALVGLVIGIILSLFKQAVRQTRSNPVDSERMDKLQEAWGSAWRAMMDLGKRNSSRRHV